VCAASIILSPVESSCSTLAAVNRDVVQSLLSYSDDSASICTSVSTWMGGRQGRSCAVNLCPFLGVDLNL